MASSALSEHVLNFDKNNFEIATTHRSCHGTKEITVFGFVVIHGYFNLYVNLPRILS